MEELAAFAANVVADENQRLMERRWAEVVDFHVASHGEDVERVVELAHGFVEKGGYNAAVDMAGWAFVYAGQLDLGRGGGGFRVSGVGGEDKVQALRVGWAATKAVIGSLVDGGR